MVSSEIAKRVTGSINTGNLELDKALSVVNDRGLGHLGDSTTLAARIAVRRRSILGPPGSGD